MERTLVLVKPDGVQRGLIGPILERFERRGFKIVGLKLLRVSRDLAERHYAEHVGKPFYPTLIAYITAGPVVAAVLEGPGAIATVRAMLGKTNPLEAAPGTIRGDFGVETERNLVHASDGPESAAREIALFFSESEILDYRRATDPWILRLPDGVAPAW
ncbi:MAG: nucleoside-diphosphate kinase [Chloroflexota bacterium]|nr:nucleoside-diphosphate kinase [Dehalococcoidia bacterium]MDW8253935.1 nucleoside-diphosphate kinase [Chloroflexota bacterium]